MVRVPTILHYLEFDYYDTRKHPKRESLLLLAVGYCNVLSQCYFITRKGVCSGWHGSWSADEHDDVGVPTRLTLFFSWRGTEAIQYRQVMQYSQDMTWTNISGQPTFLFWKSWSTISMLFVSITDECTWEAEKVVDILKDYNFYELTSSSQTPGVESDSTQHVNVGVWCLMSGSERDMRRTGKEVASL